MKIWNMLSQGAIHHWIQRLYVNINEIIYLCFQSQVNSLICTVRPLPAVYRDYLRSLITFRAYLRSGIDTEKYI